METLIGSALVFFLLLAATFGVKKSEAGRQRRKYFLASRLPAFIKTRSAGSVQNR